MALLISISENELPSLCGGALSLGELILMAEGRICLFETHLADLDRDTPSAEHVGRAHYQNSDLLCGSERKMLLFVCCYYVINSHSDLYIRSIWGVRWDEVTYLMAFPIQVEGRKYRRLLNSL